MKKIVVLIVAIPIVFLCLSGCLDTFRTLPSDDECQQIISAYLLNNSRFYDSTDTIYLGEWEGIGCRIRMFDWCHTQSPDVIGTYCGAGHIDCKGEIVYNGD